MWNGVDVHGMRLRKHGIDALPAIGNLNEKRMSEGEAWCVISVESKVV